MKTIPANRWLNRTMYAAMVLFSIVLMIIYREPGAGLSMLGISLIFDPFDPNVKFGERPLYQKAWLVLHASAVFILLIIGLIN